MNLLVTVEVYLHLHYLTKNRWTKSISDYWFPQIATDST